MALALPPTATAVSGAHRIEVSSFTASREDGRLSAQGLATVRIGATARLGTGLPPGRYLGTFPVTVVYD